MKRAEILDEALNHSSELRKKEKHIHQPTRDYEIPNHDMTIPSKIHQDEESKEQNESVFYDLRP